MTFFILMVVFLLGLIFALGLSTYDEVKTEIEIEGSADDVWDALSNFDDYSSWNPFVTTASGEPKAGASTDFTVALPFSKSMDFSFSIDTAEKANELIWKSHFLEPKIFDGIHHFSIETIEPGKVRLSQRENFTGLLLYIMFPFIKAYIESNLTKMNEALKNKVEGTVAIEDASQLQSGSA